MPSPLSYAKWCSLKWYGTVCLDDLCMTLSSLQPKMDIFVVNSFDSFWQLIFSLLMFPLVLIPGFSSGRCTHKNKIKPYTIISTWSVSFDTIGDYILDGASCIIGFTPTPEDDCTGTLDQRYNHCAFNDLRSTLWWIGEPWLMMIYVFVNLSWNVC